ncbi:LppP/LprE family lipoprotein [Mycobacterium sp. TNTM28]|uniref:LppP/LprE family lipoprotein n=1 Tax=[Mycobacterium] fortunisiensis TaxID=2600579 RepID=A0ABS6KQ09_9MYCO|nr:LppP/LprE family lipoprotein [[Mycobacterium] fortunisiensis]MBU9765705.1 LppP/LprE family lipoprotein [[Mycobacterium] fortunisiensis]
MYARLSAIIAFVGLLVVGCGWSPSSPPPPKPDTCAPADGPSADTIADQIAALPAPEAGRQWTQIGSGHTSNCRLYWVQVGQTNPEPNSAGQLLFFDRQTPLGPATPEPRPYINVVTNADDTVVVNYQWQQGHDSPTSPTGIATVRFRIGEDGKLVAVDPIPKP